MTYTSHVAAHLRGKCQGIMSSLVDDSPRCKRRCRRQCLRWKGIVLFGGIVLACWLCSLGVPVPRWDDGIYKSPGAELAQHGRLIVPAAKGFLPQADRVFAAYPPLYQLGGCRLVPGVWGLAPLFVGLQLHVAPAGSAGPDDGRRSPGAGHPESCGVERRLADRPRPVPWATPRRSWSWRWD